MRAFVVASAGTPGRMAGQLAELAGTVEVLSPARDGARAQLAALAGGFDAAAASREPVAVVADSLVVSVATLERVLDDPALELAALVAHPSGEHPVATQAGTVLSAGTALHAVPEADGEFLGVVMVGAPHVPAAADALRRALGAADADWDALDAVDTLLAALVRAPALPPVTAVPLAPLPGARCADPAGVEPPAAEEGRQLLARSSARPHDGAYSTFVLRRLSARLTPSAVRRGVRANAVTVVSALVGCAGAAVFAVHGYGALIAGVLLLQLSLVLDCVDGEIARATRTRSAFGGWLDAVTDRVKEYGALAGLAAHGGTGWLLAAAGMVVQTVRHVHDFSYDKGALAAWRAGFRDQRPLSDRRPWQPPPGAQVGPHTLRLSAGQWARRLIRMPIGERWMLLCVVTLAAGPVPALMAYLVAGAVAVLWSLAGALRRGPFDYPASVRLRLASYRDDGVPGPAIRWAPGGLLGWLLPGLVTAAEGAAVVGLTAAYAPGAAGAAFGWCAVIAWRRYDLVYRTGGRLPPSVINRLGAGWLLRIVFLAAAAGGGIMTIALSVGLVWLAVLYVPESLRAGASTARLADGRA